MQKELDRSSPEDCETALAIAIPDTATRLSALRVLSAGIFAVHLQSPAGWGVTLFRTGLRLNVGSAEAFTISPALVRALVLQSGAVSGVPDDVSSLLSPCPYRSTPFGTELFAVPSASFAAFEGWLRSPFVAFVTAASLSKAGRPRRTSFHTTHSPGVVAYASRVLGEALPRPEHTRTRIGAGT
jgi:hypothetical protein